ncbi:MAG TPA: TIGR02680 family protein [Ktedonobacteraceae bacterium]|nr:TIGR02680 family protein [Ktedonobacteraceae bacterium]
MQRTFEKFTALTTGADGANEDGLDRRLEMFVETLQAFAGGPRGYRLRRIILTNFWLYGLQEFEIPHGRLFLAGENASGKSTVLTAALPLALDGDLRPNRIDTFGGRERHVEYYVLGGSESATPFNHERRTSYIALEFEWCNPDMPPIAPELRQRWENGDHDKTRFLTIGISLAGNVNASDRIRPLRFLITDGSRLGYDLHTIYETGNKHDKRAYDHARFKQQLEGHGIICDSQAEYERQVARHLFGFSDEKDLEKLINLLLVLRRPNLSSELSFSRVHDYLKQSLRKISGETTHRVIGTIERIDAIQAEIERIQEAFNATDHLHTAQQNLALVRAQVAGCDYLGAQLAEDTVLSRVKKLRRDVSTAENERRKADIQAQTLQTEQYQVSGQIKALETSEGLQVASQLTAARERTHEAEAQLHLQEQSREAAAHSIEVSLENLAQQRERFARTKTESAAQVRELLQIASDEALWEVATFQLEEALQQVNAIAMDAPFRPEVPLAVTSLLGEQSAERSTWLRRLEELHQQREKLEAKVQNARMLETMRFQELDEARRRFSTVQDRGYEAQQNLINTLKQFAAAMGDDDNPSFALEALNEEIQSQGEIGDDESLTGSIVEQFALALDNYRQVIDALERELLDAADSAQGELNELQLLTGSKNHEIAEIQSLYEQKLAEPEYAPLRPTRRTLARTKLAKQGITALPLYALLDFVPGIDDAEAGRIEYMLEDAGLLDALVVAPAQIAAADALLATEGLSDCRLNIADIADIAADLNADNAANAGGIHGLRFDTSVNADAESNAIDWEAVATKILATVGAQFIAPSSSHTVWSANEDGSWTHGLLTGQAGTGEARCIGKATRLRVRQRELDEIDAQRTKLEEELRWLHGQLAQYEQELTQLQDKQAQVRKFLPTSGLDEIHAELAQARLTLDDARSKYQKTHLQTQEVRQRCNGVIAALERESNGVAPFASELRHVQNALMGVVKLKNSAKSLQLHLSSILHNWEDYQKASASLEKARANEANILQMYERVRSQALQAKAEVEELQRVAAFANAEELSNRLRSLREQSESLARELEETRASFIRADERVNGMSENLTEAEAQLLEVQQLRTAKQARFSDALYTYPVEQLVRMQQLAAHQQYAKAALAIAKVVPAGETLRESDVVVRKEQLEAEERDTYNALARVFNREQPVLLEYGPDLDDQGHVVFLNEQKSRPVELLELLGERIEMQKTLLGQEERQLFEDFLLQEIAEAIRTHILEAEEWVQQINTVLSGLPMIGEHYALQWKPLPEYDVTKLGSHLAQQYRLLRKPVPALTAEETETLMSAFRSEIDSVRLRQQENPETNFMDALEQVFDYREWFHFDVLVTPIGGQRQRLTDKVAGTRSGAEQLFALYVPLFAALGALYRNAAPGAPRLLALDEAFDKVSVANTQRIMEFLVSQDFQWIMTGPQVSGTGSKIPACARYMMIHEKGSPVATASASFWSDSQSL